MVWCVCRLHFGMIHFYILHRTVLPHCIPHDNPIPLAQPTFPLPPHQSAFAFGLRARPMPAPNAKHNTSYDTRCEILSAKCKQGADDGTAGLD